jgi:hypothetical protein
MFFVAPASSRQILAKLGDLKIAGETPALRRDA